MPVAARTAAHARGELARTKEVLANSQQETTELKSRVKQLEDINDKGQHLLSLKDSEIADLQNKLKAMQAEKASAPATAEAAKPAETPPAAQPAAETTAGVTETSSSAATAVRGKPDASSRTDNPVGNPRCGSSAGCRGHHCVDARCRARDGGTGQRFDTCTDQAPAEPPPVKAPVPLPPNKPAAPGFFSDNSNLLYGLGAILLLLGGWVWSRSRGKPKPVVRPQFGAGAAGLAASAASAAPQEAAMQAPDGAAEHPQDVGAELEQLRYYYEQSDAPHFEALAESVHSHLTADEWSEVLAMGEGLSPHHPLFAEPAAAGYDTGFSTLPGTADPRRPIRDAGT